MKSNKKTAENTSKLGLNQDVIANIANEDERQIAELILESVRKGIIEDCSNDNDGYFFRFKLAATQREYEVYFESRLDKRKNNEGHSGAERAIKASEFVIALTEKISENHNCYVVPSKRISAPSVQSVASYVGCDLNLLKISKERSKVDGMFSDDTLITHELEVAVIASIGEHYELMVEAVTVQENKMTGELSFKYRSSSDHTPFDDTEGEKAVKIGERERSDASNLFGLITGSEKRVENNQKILTALAQPSESGAEESDFRKFISGLSDDTVTVGQINVIPSALFVGTEKSKNFVYTLGEKGCVFTVSWNKSAEAFNKESKLYILHDKSGKFLGLTYKDKVTLNDGEELTLEPFEVGTDSIVVAYECKNKKLKPVCATLLYPGKPGATVNEYKGVKNFAVMRSGLSDTVAETIVGEGVYILNSDAEYVDEGVYYKEDCAVCEYSKEKHWAGNLEEKYFVDTDSTFKKGMIYCKTMTTAYSKKLCVFCGTEYFADAEREKKYSIKTRLLDGNHYCGVCIEQKKVSISQRYGKQETAELIDAYKDQLNQSQKPDGKIFAITDGGLLRLAKNSTGHVFKCSQCEKIIYTAKSHAENCDVCYKALCLKCKDDRTKYHKLMLYEGPVRNARKAEYQYCDSCPEGDSVIGARLIRSVKKANTSLDFGAIFTNPATTDKAYHCGVCGDPVYDESGTRAACDCCGRAVERTCYDNRTPYKGMRLCNDCLRLAQNGDRKAIDASLNQLNACVSAMNDLKDKEQWLINWISTVGIKKIMHHFTFSDRKAILGALKNGTANVFKVDILKFSIPQKGKFSDRKEKLYARFTIRCASYTYYFNMIGKKIILELEGVV